MTRRLLLGTISAEGLNDDKVQSNSKGSHTEIYMLTDRSAAGNALIHDQSNTIIESSDSDEDLSGSPDKGAVKREKAEANRNLQLQQQ